MTDPDSTMLRVGGKKQLFFDNVLLEAVEDITRTVHTPTRHDPGPVLTADRPWEAVPYFSPGTWNVIHDEADGLFKCWYSDWHYDREREREIAGLHDERIRLLYAESEDGIEWRKPTTAQFREGGRDTNIVLGGGDEFGVQTSYVVKDPAAEDPDARFKTLFRRISPREDDPTQFERVIRAAHSPDGVEWTVRDDPPRCGDLGSNLGDVFSMDYDPDSRTWLSYVRHPEMGHPGGPDVPSNDGFLNGHRLGDFARENRRRIFRMESGDFHHWSEPRRVLAPDERDAPDQEMYGMAQYRVPDSDLRVGFVNVLDGVENTIHVQLAYSRDGHRWRRYADRQPWLDTSEAGWDRHMVNVMAAPVRVGDRLYIYHGGSRNHHDWWLTGEKEGLDPEAVPEAYDQNEVDYSLGLATLRADGFVSLDAAGPRPGTVVTRPLLTDGQQLVVNTACNGGGVVSVAVADRNGEVFEGYGWGACDDITGDSTAHTVSWGGTERLPAAEYYKLRVRMRDARLYSVQFE
jgi:hypothetical protein